MDMTTWSAKAITVVALLMWSFATSAQSLWQNTTYGMSLAEVQTSQPKAALSKKTGRLHDGSESLLERSDFELVNEKFKVLFYFREAKLTQVTLTLEHERDFHSVLLVFDQLTLALRAKYGEEKLRKLDTAGALKKASADWVNGGTNISLVALTVGNSPAVLNLNYQVRIAREAGKL